MFVDSDGNEITRLIFSDVDPPYKEPKNRSASNMKERLSEDYFPTGYTMKETQELKTVDIVHNTPSKPDQSQRVDTNQNMYSADLDKGTVSTI